MDLSLVQGDKDGSICILLHADLQLNQQPFIEKAIFFPLDVFSSFVKDQVSILYQCVGSFLDLQSYSIDLPACHYTNTMQFLTLLLEVWDTNFSRSSFTVENSFSYPGFFVIPDKFENFSF